MSAHSATARLPDPQSSHDEVDGRIHAHVSSIRFYVAIFVALGLLTFATLAVGTVHLGPANLAIAIAIASAKATLVVTFFMHLAHDRRFHAIVLITALLFIGVFFAYTFNDTAHRGEVDPNSAVPVYGTTGESAPGGAGVQDFVAPTRSRGAAGTGHE